MIYENGTLSKILTDEEYITLSGTTPTYHYYLKDHLGNNRVVLNQNGTTVEQMNHYYPFGGLFDQTSETLQAYKYNGKELDRTYGIDLYDYSARFMDGAVGRFTTMDPLAEKYYSVSPYLYCGGNPMNRIDPTGMMWDNVKEAERLKSDIDKRIASLNKDIARNQAKLDKGELNEKQVAKLEGKISEAQDRISNLNTSKADIDILGADQNNMYALSQTNGGLHQVKQGSDGKIYIETSSDALSIHEITHVRQSLDAGGLKFSSNGELLNVGSMASSSKRPEIVSNMEIEAYKMQYSYDLSFPGRTSNLQGINVHSVGNIMNNGIPVYSLIYNYSKLLKQQQKFIGN